MPKEDVMQTIDRAIKILKSYTEKDKELSLADLHKKLGLSKSSLQRILNTLVHHGLLDKDDKQKTYRLGIELYFLGELVEKNSTLLSCAKPHMETLRDRLGESVHLNIIHQGERKCIGYLSSRHELITLINVGQTSPLYAGASAKVLMAHLPDSELSDHLTGIKLDKITDTTIKSSDDLMKEIIKIRDNGYAISFGERVIGAFSVSAPIRNHLNEVIAGLSLTIPMARVEKDKIDYYIDHVKETAALISNKLK
jgi:IclR family transcriptional regulator, KDG regulon repressor